MSDIGRLLDELHESREIILRALKFYKKKENSKEVNKAIELFDSYLISFKE